MPIVRTTIDTSHHNKELGAYFDVPVYYTNELMETRASELAYSSVVGGYLPYLLAGYFTDGIKQHQWYFSNAKRHEEMREAVEKEIGKGFAYYYGQLKFESEGLPNGKLIFENMTLHSGIPNEKIAIQLLRGSIKPSLFSKDFKIFKPRI